MNGFYASVECFYHPEIRNKPVAVGGDPEQRHGIILAKNEIAKKYGIKTGEALWQAKNRCPSLVIVPPNYKLYLEYAKLSREIYNQYTDRVQPFGLDEAWLDLTGCEHLFGDGEYVANELRYRIQHELGITASVGVSWNKIFAKLGSDMKKPNATTIITPENFKQKAWPLPASDLLYVGPATTAKLAKRGVRTIGELAQTDPQLLKLWFGKVGRMLWTFANGYDTSLVSSTVDAASEDGIKSIGNSTTTPRDLVTMKDVKITMMLLAESVARRMREHNRLCRTVQIYIRDKALYSFERQCKLSSPTQLAQEVFEAAMRLFQKNYAGFDQPGSSLLPIRSIGVRACDLTSEDENMQLSFFPEEQKRQERMQLERTIDDVRRRYGHTAISRGLLLADRNLSKTNPYDDHIIFPAGWHN